MILISVEIKGLPPLVWAYLALACLLHLNLKRTEFTLSKVSKKKIIHPKLSIRFNGNSIQKHWEWSLLNLTEFSLCAILLLRRKWQYTPVFLPGESHGQRSLAGHGPWGRRDSDTTVRNLSIDFSGLFLNQCGQNSLMVQFNRGCNSRVKWSESCSFMSDSLWPHGLYSPWNSPGQSG